jgi:hypothetical protein
MADRKARALRHRIFAAETGEYVASLAGQTVSFYLPPTDTREKR